MPCITKLVSGDRMPTNLNRNALLQRGQTVAIYSHFYRSLAGQEFALQISIPILPLRCRSWNCWENLSWERLWKWKTFDWSLMCRWNFVQNISFLWRGEYTKFSWWFTNGKKPFAPSIGKFSSSLSLIFFTQISMFCHCTKEKI